MGDTYAGRRSLPANKTESKVEFYNENKRNGEDNGLKDPIRRNYHSERPLLPLKPLPKQRSRSCTSLVQTFKGFRLRKTSADKRYSSPEFRENEFSNKREICKSEANISKDYSREDSEDEVIYENPRKMSDIRKYPTIENVAWYHPIDAKEACRRLVKMDQNGAFLIRPASKPSAENFHTLCVLFSGHVYNFHLKNLKNGQVSLGDRKNEAFSSMLELIKYHQLIPISIKVWETGEQAHVHLLITPSK